MPKNRNGKRFPSDSAPGYRKYRTAWEIAKSIKVRKAVIAAYGNRCACCGEMEYTFLEVDHINNDPKERVAKGEPRGGQDLCKWLVRHEFPEGFQILCRNCNWGKWVRGICPHRG